MSDTILADLNGISVGPDPVSTSRNTKKPSDGFENRDFGAVEQYDDEIAPPNQSQAEHALGPEPAEKTNSDFKEVLQKRLEGDSQQKSGTQEDDSKPKEGFKVESPTGKIQQANAVKNGGQVQQNAAVVGSIQTDGLPKVIQTREQYQNQAEQKGGQLNKVTAAFGKDQPQPAESVNNNKAVLSNQEKSQAGLLKMENQHDLKGNEFLAKVAEKASNQAMEAPQKLMTQKGPNIKSVGEQQANGQIDSAQLDTGKIKEQLKLQAEQAVKNENNKPEQIDSVALRSELKLKQANKNTFAENSDALQLEQKVAEVINLTEPSPVKAQVSAMAGPDQLQPQGEKVTNISGPQQQVNNSASDLSIGEIKSVGQQILENISANVRGIEREIRIMLNPPELGRVRIQFEQRGDEITGYLQVEKAQTRYEVERQLPEIVASLQQDGVPVRRIEVTHNSYNEPGEHKSNTADDFHGTGQGELGEQRNTDGSNENDEQAGPRSRTILGDRRERKGVSTYQVGDDSINIYV